MLRNLSGELCPSLERVLAITLRRLMWSGGWRRALRLVLNLGGRGSSAEWRGQLETVPMATLSYSQLRYPALRARAGNNKTGLEHPMKRLIERFAMASDQAGRSFLQGAVAVAEQH